MHLSKLSRWLFAACLIIPTLAACNSSAQTPSSTNPLNISPTSAASSPNGEKPELVQSSLTRQQMPEVSPADLQQLAEGNNAFALDLLHQLETEGGNLFYSPFSISIALAMTYAGARGTTAEQMANVLHFTLPPDRLHPAFNLLEQQLSQVPENKVSEAGEAFQLSIANSLWGQQGYPFQSDFLDTLAVNYGAGMRLVDYTADPEQARQAINQWVEDATQQKIKDLVPQGAIDSLTRLVLANAIYFKANWLSTFNPQATEPAPFQLSDGTTIDVPMMYQSGDFGYAKGSNFQAVSLPYVGQRTSMLLILPDEIQLFSSNLDSTQLESIHSSLKHTQVVLSLPKFEIAYDFSVPHVLKNLGMVDAFDSGQADFSGMDGSRDLYVSDILHKAIVSVDENGTEAAAATAVIVGLTSIPSDQVTLTFDRPFLFFIMDDQTGSVLFVGSVMHP